MFRRFRCRRHAYSPVTLSQCKSDVMRTCALGKVMRRRDFFKTVVGSARLWSFAAHAQQLSKRVGLLGLTSPETFAERLATFKRGLAEAGFVENQKVAIEYRWARGQFDQLSVLAAGLVRQGVNVIAALGTPAWRSRPRAPAVQYLSCSSPAAIQSAGAGRQPQSAQRQCDRHLHADLIAGAKARRTDAQGGPGYKDHRRNCRSGFARHRPANERSVSADWVGG